jgi:predicted PurR-regulated permease PerM
VTQESFDRLTRQINEALKARDKRFDLLEKHLQRKEKAAMASMSQSQRIDFLREMQQRTMSYLELVAVLGYGGVLTLWSGLVSRLPVWLMALTGGMLLLSLLTFIGWELFKAWLYGSTPRTDPETWAAEIQRKTEDLDGKWFKAQFACAVVTGVGSALILLVLFFSLPILDALDYHLIGTPDPSRPAQSRPSN